MGKEQSDIVERLRTHAAGGIPLADPLATLKDCVKAADELELLRSALAAVVVFADSNQAREGLEPAIEIARAALKAGEHGG